MAKVDLADILQLTVEERIELAQQIWDSIAQNPDAVPVTQEQRDELARRLAEHDANPDNVVPWDEAEKRIRSNLSPGGQSVPGAGASKCTTQERVTIVSEQSLHRQGYRPV